jgi:hypothetical protein
MTIAVIIALLLNAGAITAVALALYYQTIALDQLALQLGRYVSLMRPEPFNPPIPNASSIPGAADSLKYETDKYRVDLPVDEGLP